MAGGKGAYKALSAKASSSSAAGAKVYKKKPDKNKSVSTEKADHNKSTSTDKAHKKKCISRSSRAGLHVCKLCMLSIYESLFCLMTCPCLPQWIWLCLYMSAISNVKVFFGLWLVLACHSQFDYVCIWVLFLNIKQINLRKVINILTCTMSLLQVYR